jgi:ferrous iron transport protein A
MSTPFQELAPLCQLPAGATGRVCQLTGDESFCQRIREMGFGEAALVTKISGSVTSLCLVNGTRLALNHSAAMSILVERLPAGAK